MNRTTTTRLGCAATALALVCALSACQPETVSATAPATTAPGTSTRAPEVGDPGPVRQPSSSSPASPSTTTRTGDTTPRAPYGTDGGTKGTAPRGVFGDHGGYLVDGSKVTFVYANGVRFTVDVGQTIDNPQHAKIKAAKGTLTLRPTRATWSSKAGATSFVDRSGAGTIINHGGVIVVLGNGTSTCANSDGLQFVGSSGDKATASKGGLFYIGPDGKKTSFGAPKSGSRTAGQFTVCGIGDQVSMDLFSDVLFAFDKSSLTPAGTQVVKSAASTIKDDVQGRAVQVTGHTDSLGTPAANKRLGLKRARSVANQLKSLIPGLHVAVRSAGQTEPIAANTHADGSDNPDGRAKNRRVTITYTR